MEGGAVPNGLYFGNGTHYVLERICLGPLAQFRPFHGPWVPLQSRSTEALQLPMVAPEIPSMLSVAADPRGLVVLCPDAGHPQTASQGTPTE